MTDDLRVTCHGKQLKLDGRHLADCVSDQAAEAIAICLNYGAFEPCRTDLDSTERGKVEEFFA